jgi:hypothetical protein
MRDSFLEGWRLGHMQRYNVSLVPVPGGTAPHRGVSRDKPCDPYPGIEVAGNPNGR